MSASGCQPTKEVKADIRSLAKHLLAAGYMDHAEIVEKIHSMINTEEFPIWKSQIADIVEGYGDKSAPKETRDELAQKVLDMKRELKRMRESVDGKTPPRSRSDEEKIAARKRDLQSKIDDLELKIRAGDKSVPAKRSSVTTPAIETLKAERDRLQSRLNGGEVKNDAEKAALKRQLQAVNEKLAGKIAEQRAPEHRADDAEMSDVKAKLANARAALAAKNLEASKRAALEDRIAGLLQRLAGKPKDGAAPKAPDSARVAELKRIRDQLRSDLHDLEHPKRTPDEIANARRMKQIERDLAEYQRRITEGDFAPRQRNAPVYTTETMDALTQLNKTKLAYEKLVKSAEYKNANPAIKAFSWMLAIRRASIFSSPAIFAKLTAAAGSKMVLTPIEGLIGTGLLRHVFPGVYDKSPRHGGNFSDYLAGEKAALSPEMWKRTLSEIKSKWKGVSDLKAAFGKDLSAEHIPALLEVPGRTHGIIKTTPEINEYFRSVSRVASSMRRRAIAGGMSPAEAQAYIEDPKTQIIIGQSAYEESQRAVLMNNNAGATWVKTAIATVGSAGKPGTATRGIGRTLEFAANMELPIKKVPFNLLTESTSYVAGGIKAAMHGYAAKGRELTPHEADMIAMNLQKQVVGVALMAMAWIFYGGFGGYFHSGEKRKDGMPGPGDANIDGHTVDKQWLHTPAMNAVMMAADARRAYEAAHTDKLDKKGNVTKPGESVPVAAAHAGFVAAKDPIRELSFIDALARIHDGFEDPSRAAIFLGENIRDTLVPSAVQFAARKTDTETARKRKPDGPLDAIKLGIPGLRESVGFGDPKQLSFQERMDAYNEMSPSERADNNMLKHVKDAARRHRKDMTPDQRDQLRTILDTQS